MSNQIEISIGANIKAINNAHLIASSIGIKAALKITFISKATNTIKQAKILDQ